MKTTSSSLLFLVLSCFLCVPTFSTQTWAQTEIDVKTPWDHYKLTQTGTHYTLGGKKVNSTHLDPLLTLLSTPATGPCASPVRPQIQIKTKDSKKALKTYKVHLDQGLLQGPEGCLTLSGSGIDAFPLHRTWLIGPFDLHMEPKKSLHLKNSSLDFKAKKNRQDWEVTPANPTFNYEFLEQLANSLRDFHVDQYLHISAAKGKPTTQMSVDGRKVILYQLAPTTWGLRTSKKPWLMVSSRWSFWKDLDQALWTDAHSKAIQDLLSNDESQQKKQLEDLGGAWSESLKRAFQQCLLRNENSTEVRILCLHKMKSRPTDSNFKTVIGMIQETEDSRLLKEASDFLRIKNPKGPSYSEKINLDKFRKDWKNWWARSHPSD